MTKKFLELWGTETNMIESKEKFSHEAKVLMLDCTKARNRLHWSPKLDAKQSLSWTVKWYQSYNNNEDMRIILMKSATH